jgi:membrane protease YdiL (CAAX protease family)
MKPFSQLMFCAITTLAVFFVSQLVTALIAVPFFGFSKVATLLNGVNMTDPESISMLKFFQVSQTIGLFILPSFIVAYLIFDDTLHSLQLMKASGTVPSVLTIGLIFALNPFINLLGEFNSGMHFPEWLSGMEQWMRNAEDSAAKLTEVFLETDQIQVLLFNLVMVAVLPALGEELLFRGVIQKILIGLTKNNHAGIWLSAALFSALHMQFFGFFPRMILGAVFGYLLVWSGSLWLPVLAHFVNNAGAVIALYLIDKGMIGPVIEDFGARPGTWGYAISGFVIGLILLLIIRQQTGDRKRIKVEPGNPA